jgi:hypothetical protein
VLSIACVLACRVVSITIESSAGLETLVKRRSSIPLREVGSILLLISISSSIGRDTLHMPAGLWHW